MHASHFLCSGHESTYVFSVNTARAGIHLSELKVEGTLKVKGACRGGIHASHHAIQKRYSTTFKLPFKKNRLPIKI
jgi:hypothetical protein